MFLFLLFAITALADFGNLWTAAQGECTVTLDKGTVSGVLHTFSPQKKVCTYTSIPFAKPPINELRFKAPQPASAWGFLNATSFPDECPQNSNDPKKKISENCLYLNVFTNYKKKGNAGKELPVMIWFHGGGYKSGSSQLYIPTKLMARDDIVFVSAQYRLGVIGFFSTFDKSAPGNFGLKDQAFAIRWVSENIKAFGGDPKKITIFGESAGGSSVMYQLITPLNKGLISGVISQSGTALATWAIDRNPLESARAIAKRLGCPTELTGPMVECMRNVDWKKIVKEQGKYSTTQALHLDVGNGAQSPVVEPNLPGAFIKEEPEKIMRSGKTLNVPVMIGATKHDGSFLLATLYVTAIGPLKLDQNPQYLREKIVPDLLKIFQVTGDGANGGLPSSVEMTYLAGANRTNWMEIMPGLVDLLSVFAFKSSIQTSADILSQRNKNIFVYSFEHHSNNTLWPLFFGTTKIPVGHGVAHGDELIYMFEIPGAKFSKADQQMSDTMCEMWINFAKFGNPTPSQSNKYDTWLPYNANDEAFMKLNATPTLLYGYRSSWRPNGFEWN